MLILLFILLLALAALLVWLKRRHEHKLDDPNLSFNAGITSRSMPMIQTTTPPYAASPYAGGGNGKTAATVSSIGVLESGAGVGVAGNMGNRSGSGRNSPARTREAFMPYGYGYARSESRLASASNGKLASGGQQARDDAITPVQDGGRIGTPTRGYVGQKYGEGEGNVSRTLGEGDMSRSTADISASGMSGTPTAPLKSNARKKVLVRERDMGDVSLD